MSPPSHPAMQLFLETYLLGNRTLTKIATLEELLPSDPAELRALASHTAQAAIEATERNYHVEGRRLVELARQLTKRATKIEEDMKTKG